jgi:multidrug efflux pump subunit AcrA (membrane-fusion protein)
MRGKGMTCGFVLVLLGAGEAWAQGLPTSARIETIPIELTTPDRYQVSEVLEPIRRITLVAPADGVIQNLGARLGSAVRETQVLVELDPREASARVKVAQAEVKETQALVGSDPKLDNVHKAQLEAAQARSELAQLALDRCTLRAPFAGRVIDLPVAEGQFVLKGTTILELADLSSLKAFQPIDRRHVSAGSSLSVQIEEKEVEGKVQAIVPLPDEYLVLRELVTPLAGAWVILSNPKGELEPGLRVRTGTIPTTPLAVIPKRSIKQDSQRSAEGAIVQVIRNEFDNNAPAQIVTNLPVQVLGEVGPDRIQVTGRFRPTDSLVVATSSPLLAGTLVKFPEGAGSHGGGATLNGSSGPASDAGVMPPGSSSGRGSTPRTRKGAGSSNSPPRRQQSQPNPPSDRSGPF